LGPHAGVTCVRLSEKRENMSLLWVVPPQKSNCGADFGFTIALLQQKLKTSYILLKNKREMRSFLELIQK